MKGLKGDEFSKKRCVVQGSILGVILLLLYINDIHSSVERMISIMFTDDFFTGLVSADFLHDELESIANIQFKLLANWYRSNKLSLHPSKFKYIIFNNYSSRIPVNSTVVLNINHECLF